MTREILGKAAWIAPDLYRTTLTAAELGILALQTRGQILINRVIWRIHSKQIEGSIYSVWLEVLPGKKERAA